MLGLLVIIVISWLLLYLIEKESITVLGIIPNKKRIAQFVIGILVMTIIVLLLIFIETQVKSISWKANDFSLKTMFNAFVYHIRSALTEDLVFRGAILYILISRIGAKPALLISALIFGVYHVFSYGMTGERLIPIIYVVLVTGFTGYVWAYAFYKTKSIAIGLGFHLAYNMIMASFYPAQPFGELLFAELSSVDLSEANDSFYALFRGFFPPLMNLILLKLLLKSGLNMFKNNENL